MAEPFATVTDLEDRWRSLSTDEQDQAAVKLGDASVILRAEVPDIDARIAAGTIDPDVPVLIVCGMVKRAMLGGATDDGVSSQQQGVGPFTQSVTFANPLGNLYLTKADRSLLGSRGQKAFSIDTMPPTVASTDSWTW